MMVCGFCVACRMLIIIPCIVSGAVDLCEAIVLAGGAYGFRFRLPIVVIWNWKHREELVLSAKVRALAAAVYSCYGLLSALTLMMHEATVSLFRLAGGLYLIRTALP